MLFACLRSVYNKASFKETERQLAMAKGSDEYDRLVNAGIQAVNNQKIYEAEKLWRQARNLQPKRPEARANLAVLMERDRKFEQALPEYKYAAEKLGTPWDRFYKELEQYIQGSKEKMEETHEK